jgi:hypothetical protein
MTKPWVLPALLLLAGSAAAQDDKPPAKQETGHYFRLDFLVKEINDGRTTNSRVYSTIVSTKRGENDSIRTGSRVPVPQGTDGYSYLDVGVNIDCRSVEETAGKLMLNVSSDISSLADNAPAPAHPVIRSNKWSSNVVVPMGKPTTIFSSDDVGSKGKMQMELTATPII